MARRLLAYNFERAVKHQTIVIVEGPGDVWSMGPQAMGLMGKTMNPALQQRFVASLKLADPKQQQTVCVMLDPDQDPREVAKRKPHHIERLVHELRPALGNRVFGVYLPPGMDPGSMDRDWLRDRIRERAAEEGLKVSFGRPALARN